MSSSEILKRMEPFSGNLKLAAIKALVIADSKSWSIPMTSPVDFISGPRYVSTPVNLDIENTGAFTPTISGAEYRPVPYPMFDNWLPSMDFTARLTIGTPVTLEIKGMVLLDLGFTSITNISVFSYSAAFLLTDPGLL